jgi:chloramphenicol O-acetyltransferase type A
MTFDLDVTRLVSLVKQEQTSFYLSLMHHVIMSMNTIENFQYRIDSKGVFLQPIEYVSFTDKRDEDLFKMVFCPFDDDRVKFIEQAKATSSLQGNTFFVPSSELILNTVYVTSFPWRKFNHFSHATLLGPQDSVPRVSWSRYEEQQGRLLLTLSIEVHHGLVDGVHVAHLLDEIERRINA